MPFFCLGFVHFVCALSIHGRGQLVYSPNFAGAKDIFSLTLFCSVLGKSTTSTILGTWKNNCHHLCLLPFVLPGLLYTMKLIVKATAQKRENFVPFSHRVLHTLDDAGIPFGGMEGQFVFNCPYKFPLVDWWSRDMVNFFHLKNALRFSFFIFFFTSSSRRRQNVVAANCVHI